MMNALEINGLCKSFKRRKAIDELNLSIPKDSLFGIVGKSGSGKTTTIKSIVGLIKPDKGEIRVEERRVVFGRVNTNKRIGYLPNAFEIYPYMNAREYLSLFAKISRVPKKKTPKEIDKIFELVGEFDEKERIKNYSMVMKKRLGIAQALMGNPRILILDDPTSGLDIVERNEILDIILKAKKERTILLTTNKLSDVERICTDAAIIDDGRIVYRGSVEDIKKIRRIYEYKIEGETEEDTKMLMRYFNSKAVEGNSILVFSDKEKMHEICRRVYEKEIRVYRIEKREPDLEALFLEEELI